MLSDPIAAYLTANKLPGMDSISNTQNSAAALIGRLSNYTANFNFISDGILLPSGSASKRTFATESYDFYLQDAWKIRPNLTVTLGLRYGYQRPVYEQNGLEVRPVLSLGDYFDKRVEGSAKGVPFNDPIVLNLSGPANGKP